MIKCKECGKEFSNGRKITCCISTHFGLIFEDNRKSHNWNIKYLLKKNKLNLNHTGEISELNSLKKHIPILNNWNLEPF
ncbi:MAG: hypothetical protein ACFFEY_02465 [Candidatus Thorarchaeota archaeon]